MKFLSIIIPLYNTEHLIERCLNSCINQGFEEDEYEIIVVNDGSTDNSLDIAKSFESKYKNLIVITQKNQKQGTARNNGLKIATGEYIWFVDSDDWIEPNSLKEIYSFINCEIDVFRFDAIDYYSNTKKQRSCKHIPNRIYSRHEVLLENRFSVCVPFHLFKRKFLLENKLYFLENIFFEDNEFMLRVFEKTNKFLYVNKQLYCVFQRENSTTRTTDHKRYLDLFVVINSYIDYLQMNSFDTKIQRVFSLHISQCMNSLLIGTAKSSEVYESAVNYLVSNIFLFKYIRKSRSFFHIVEYQLLRYPFILRKLLIQFYSL